MKSTKDNPDVMKNSSSVSHYNAYEKFLDSHIYYNNDEFPDKKPTNTRIPDKTKKVKGGSYYIPDEHYPDFMRLYSEHILKTNREEFLTEKQLDTDGPIYVDLDLHFNHEVEERLVTQDHIDDLVDTYLEELKSMFQFENNCSFNIFVMQKPSVNRLADKSKTKDGIHLMICIQADRTIQQILRERVLKKVAEMWEDLPIINKWDDVFDEGITNGPTNCQMYGSRKPNHTAYKVTHAYKMTFDKNDESFKQKLVKDFADHENMRELSVRNKDIPMLLLKNDFAPFYNDYKHARQGGKPMSNKSSTQATHNVSSYIGGGDLMARLKRVKTAIELDVIVNEFTESIKLTDYDISECHAYAMILPEKYYGIGCGCYDRWMKVGFALKNCGDDRLLITWVKFSSQAKNFKYADIPDICGKWYRMDIKTENCVTKRSLMHWAKQDAKDEFMKIRNDSVDYWIEQTITGTNYSMKGNDKANKGECQDWDLAKVLHVLYKDEFVCVTLTGDKWFQYIENRWVETERGHGLRTRISTEMRELYNNRILGQLNGIMVNVSSIVPSTTAENDEDEQANIRKIRSQRILNICQRLKKTADKKNIMTEARDLFYDSTFMQKLDNNPFLLCFNNGVVDFTEKVFRKGRPDDCVSKCTNINYVELDKISHGPIIKEIDGFFRQLFPDKQIFDYMRDYLASILIGKNQNQTFNMLIGGGSNGKSKMVELMKEILGDYKGEVPLSLITGERTRIGGLAPEIVQLIGIRMAVMQEPSKGDKINEGKLKELTGGDPINARAPYQIQTISFMPQFKLSVCSNTLMEIGSNDHGTWRRIRVVPFEALFTNNPVHDDPVKPYQFMVDLNIETKFQNWKEVFMSMLIEHAYVTNGVVKDCDRVLAASNEYRQKQDFISEFIRDKVARDPHGKIKKTELNNEFQTWYMSAYGRGGPNVKDVHECMDKMYGRQKNQCWTGVKIRYERDEYDMPDVDSDLSDINPGDL
jgi:P4 family phage/plasmid primase-like protien